MSILNWDMLDAERSRLAGQWRTSGDVRYILMEDFIAPGTGPDLANYQIIQGKRAAPVRRNHKHVHLKNGSPNARSMTAPQRQFFEEVNSERFCAWLSGVTGIDPVYPDPELFGGGLHEIHPGGYLNIHTDFNHHPKTLKHRRMNLLVYLNEGWDPAWGGDIELWDESVSRPFVKEAPTMGRALIFETTERAFHGHPTPLAAPPGVTRKSLATYYYSEFPAGLSPRSGTNYQLTRQQWAQLMTRIADVMYRIGPDEQGVVDALQLKYQTSDIRKAYATLTAMRSAKYTDEPYWESPDGSLSLQDPTVPA